MNASRYPSFDRLSDAAYDRIWDAVTESGLECDTCCGDHMVRQRAQERRGLDFNLSCDEWTQVHKAIAKAEAA